LTFLVRFSFYSNMYWGLGIFAKTINIIKHQLIFMQSLLNKFILLPLLFCCSSALGQDAWATFYELNNYNQTPRYAETMAYCQRLAAASDMLHYKVFGQSHQGRDLAVLIYDKKGNFTPEAVKRSGNRIVLVQAAIHPGEPVGKDAGMQLLRDIVIHRKHFEDLNNITILFIPILNPDGHERFGPFNRINQDGPLEMGWRTNAINLNLNRDYLKADTREIKAFLDLWHHWQPDFFIDTHSTNGGDYQYTMTYAMSIFGEGYKPLINWIADDYLPVIEKMMANEGYPIFPYVTYRSWHDPRSGLISGTGHPMYSNSYVAELNRPGLLLETHMLKPYKMRVESTYLMIINTLKYLNQDNSLPQIIKEADSFTASAEFRKSPFPLRYEVLPDSVMVDFLGVEYTARKSDLSGGDWFVYNPDKPITYSIPWFNKHRVTHWVNLPEAYIIPVEYSCVIDRLKSHGIEMQLLETEKEFEIETYRFKNVRLASRSSEGRQTAGFSVEPIVEKRVFAKGSALIPMHQTRAAIIAHALEPMAPGSFAYWGFFNAVFERVEYFESYVMEKMARDMMDQDPSLEAKLKKAMEENPLMAQNPNLVLMWFYEQTPYYDQRHNIYPVGRLLKQ